MGGKLLLAPHDDGGGGGGGGDKTVVVVVEMGLMISGLAPDEDEMVVVEVDEILAAAADK